MIVNSILGDALILRPDIHKDNRGFFVELFNKLNYSKKDIPFEFVQDNFSYSTKGVLRGLHYQLAQEQGKLVTCIRGRIFDVIVDLRPNSKNFLKHYSVELNSNDFLQLWIPPGFAHGFYVLSEDALVVYKCTEFYNPQLERGIIWNDCELGIKWPNESPILSSKDSNNSTLENALSEL